MGAIVDTVLRWPIALLVVRVIDRFGAADGGLLAAGIAFNSVFALIPLALFASGLAGLFLTDPAARDEIVAKVGEIFPPLKAIVNDILTGLAASSPTASIVGLVLAGWGTSRLFASLESAVGQLDPTFPRRGIVHQTARRIGWVVAVAGIVIVALLAAPVLAIMEDLADTGSLLQGIFQVLLAVLPPALAVVALAVIYRVLPRVIPTWQEIRVPAVVGAIALYVLTRGFVFVAPRVFAGNLVYGTLGAILIGFIWLNLVFTIVVIGAAWVIERRDPARPGIPPERTEVVDPPSA